MKRNIFLTLLGAIIVLLSSCQEEELRVKYPESTPIFALAQVAEDSIMYGDSITLNVKVADPKTPLSTLEIKVVVNDEIIASEVIRTKGNSAEYSQKYSVPFVARRPHMADVEVHMSTINVEGFHRDTVLFNTKAHRPEIPSIWAVTSASSTTVECLLKTDTVIPHVYVANVAWSNVVSFRLASKITRIKKVDWTGIVFGKVNNALGLIYSAEDAWYEINDPTMLKVTRVIVDLYNFTIRYEGKPLEPTTNLVLAEFGTEALNATNSLGESTILNWKTSNVYYGEGTVMTFDGITNLENSLNPDFFEVLSPTTAKFIGATGIYKTYYQPNLKYLTVERPAETQPEALWLVGVGFGFPSTPYAKSGSWNWNVPGEYIYCRRLSPGVFQATVYINHESDNGFGDEYWRHQFSAKFFYQRGWGDNPDKTKNEGNANNFTLTGGLVAQTDGNWGAGESLLDKPGVYRIVVDMNAKTTTMTKIK